MGIAPPSEHSFATLLRDLRLRARLTQRELAHIVGYSAAQINRLEQGVRRPDAGVVAARFVEALGLRADAAQAVELIRLANIHLLDAGAPTRMNASVPAWVPAPTTELIGRDADLPNIAALFRDNGARIVTLVGPPGVGKTRLAIDAARNLSSAYSATHFVRLAAVTNAEAAVAALLAALGIQPSGTDLSATLRRCADVGTQLIVLDNFEHVLSAAAHIADVLAAQPHVAVLVTSREPLRIGGEHIYAVEPLSADAAIALFVRRAGALRPDLRNSGAHLASISEICAKVDFLPLAIELAAARVRLFDPADILARLRSQLGFLTLGNRDVTDRQRSLRSTIEWSTNLLTVQEQRLFARLGVFAGAFTMDAAEAIAMADIDDDSADMMQALVDKNLIAIERRDSQPRFYLLEMMREFAIERLTQSGELAAVARANARYYTDFVLTAVPQMRGAQHVSWLHRLDSELDNLHEALAHWLEMRDVGEGARLAHAMTAYWFPRGYQTEAARWIGHFLDLATGQNALSARAHLLLDLQSIATTAHPAKAIELAGEALAALRAIGDVSGMAQVLRNRARTARRQGDYAQARADLRECALIIAETDDDDAKVSLLFDRIGVERDSGDYAAALATLIELEPHIHRSNTVLRTWHFYLEQAIVAYAIGDLSACERYATTAVDICRDSELAIVEHVMCWLRSRLLLIQGELAAAMDILEIGASELRARGNVDGLNRTLPWQGFARHLAAAIDVAKAATATSTLMEALHLNLGTRRLLVLAETLRICAWVCADRRAYSDALTLIVAAENLAAEIGGVMAAGDDLFHRPRLQACVDATDGALRAACRKRGMSMDWDSAVAFARKALED